MTKAKQLRDLFKRPDIIKVAGAHDGLSAKLIQKNGFDAIWASGFEISASFAVPDANILTMSQNLERACEMDDVTTIPVIADCDTGYGNSNNVIHMVKRYETAGIAAVCIEDKKFPKVNSFIAGRQELAPVAEFVGKIMAAKNSQRSKDFMVIARVEALIAGRGVDEAIERAQAYTGAGADAILIHSKAKDQRQIVDFCRLWKRRAPVVIVPTTYPDFPNRQMRQLGIKVVIYANQGIRAAAKAMDETFACISKDRTKANIEKRIAPMDYMFSLQEIDKMKKDELAYLKTEEEPTDVVILAAGEPDYQKDLMNLLLEVPPAMLDINGKPLLQRNIEVLNSVGLKNIYVIAGYHNDRIDVEGIKKIVNKDYKQGYILDSLMKAQRYLNGRVLLCYGDIMFDRTIIEALIRRNEDIVLVTDPSFKKLPPTPHTLDLVRTKMRFSRGRRSLEKRSNPVLEISTKIPRHKADCEFIGISLFSKKGFADFYKEYRQAKNKYKDKRFHASPNFKRASLSDMLNEMIRKGYRMDTMEVHSGWIEIHTFENYKLASSLTRGV